MMGMALMGVRMVARFGGLSATRTVNSQESDVSFLINRKLPPEYIPNIRTNLITSPEPGITLSPGTCPAPSELPGCAAQTAKRPGTQQNRTQNAP